MHTFLTILALIAVAMIIIAVVSKPGSVYTGNKAEQNPVEGKKVRFVENESEPANAGPRRSFRVGKRLLRTS